MTSFVGKTKKNRGAARTALGFVEGARCGAGGASVVSIWNMCRNNCPAWKGLDTTARTMAKGFLSPNDGFILFHLDFFIGGSDPWHEN